ncbi:MAG: flavin reductase family protein [Actinobacteria bacterium]|nr:flavin reductase family protein [Actinomycetota bacterium]
MAEYPTGVTIVTSTDRNGGPVGLSVNSFTSLSLDPPLVLICVGRESNTWPMIRGSRLFAVNVLADGHGDVCRRFASRGIDRFADLDVVLGRNGAPLLPDVSSFALECSLDQVMPGGDHEIATGLVTALHRFEAARPLLFFRGEFTTVELGIKTSNEEEP